jgi:hypothetical protein
MCSVNDASVCGRPPSTSPTFTPASASRFAAHPPDAPEPTTMTSNVRRGEMICISAR